MNLLAIDTTTDKIALALSSGGAFDCFTGEAGSKKHNSMLLTYIDEFLAKNSITLQDIDAFGINVGPGSFTGIRIGVAAANAFSLALNKPLIEVTALEQCHDGGEELILSDCTHGYYGGYFSEQGVNYFALNKADADTYDCKKTFIEGVYPEKLLKKCLQKAESGAFVKQARPMYIKDSSAVVPKSMSIIKPNSSFLPSVYPTPMEIIDLKNL